MKTSFGVSALLFVSGAWFAAAQVQPAPAASTYVLGGGDQISIHVGEIAEISDRPIQIDPDGGIDLPLVGRVQAAGLTIAQLRVDLQKRLSKYVTDPVVSVNLIENQNQVVSVIGEVGVPGVHQLPGPRHLLEIISLAGGLRPDAGPIVIVTRPVQRGPVPLPDVKKDASGEYTTASLSLDDLMAAKHPANNIIIEPGDVISVPKGDVIYVVGDVRHAGSFALNSHASLSLMQAISLAEGLAPDAASSRARILRPVPGQDKPKEIAVNVKQIFAGKSPDVPLYPNDILFVPNSSAKSGSRRAIEAVVEVVTGAAIYVH